MQCFAGVGRPCPVVVAEREERGVLLFSDETHDELPTRLRLPKFDRYVGPEGRVIYSLPAARASLPDSA